MPKLNKQVKHLAAMAALGLASVLCTSAEAGGMDRDKLVDVTRSALQEQEVLQTVTYHAYQHDGKIGEAVEGVFSSQGWSRC